jgi:hypothetical protein
MTICLQIVGRVLFTTVGYDPKAVLAWASGGVAVKEKLAAWTGFFLDVQCRANSPCRWQ